MAMLGSSSPRDDRTSEAAATRAAPPAVAEKGLVGGLLRSTDWLVAVLPRPLRELLRRPLTSPLREQEDDEVSATILKVTVTVSAVAFVLLAITDLVDVLALHRRIRAFDADLDGGLWTWASVATEAAGAALLLLLAMTAVRWRAFAVCSLILAYFSLDDAVLIHEGIAGALDFFPHSSRIIWPLLYLPLLVGLTIQLWRIAEAQHGPQVRALVRGGLVALVVAVLLEGGSPLLFALGQGEGSIGYELEVALEEGLEMTGWIWITGGIAITLVQRLRNGPRT